MFWLQLIQTQEILPKVTIFVCFIGVLLFCLSYNILHIRFLVVWGLFELKSYCLYMVKLGS